jgi:ribose 5-phosphate isomerase A
MTIDQKALEYIHDGALVGLGSGRAATAFVRALGARVKAGLRIRGVPTSEGTAAVAREVGIPLTTLEDIEQLDLTVDGADEVDPKLDLIKGYGAALVREKIVAASSKRLVILVGDEKLVPVLGARGILPVEVVPFAEALCRRRLRALGLESQTRMKDGRPLVTDNGNHIFDCKVSAIADPAKLDRDILQIPGVLGTGIFAGMADVVLVQRGDAVEVLERKK